MRTRRLQSIGLLAVVLTAGLLGGCAGPLGWLAYVLSPPQKKKAAFELPKGKTVLVLVDDKKNPIDYDPIKARLTKNLNEQVAEHAGALRTVKYDRVVDYIAGAPDYYLRSVGRIGKDLGADVVLYVHLDKFTLRDEGSYTRDGIGSALWEGKLHATVRVVDVKEGLLWPEDNPLRGFTVPPVDLPMTIDHSPTHGIKVAEQLAETMADRIAKLFYKHRLSEKEQWDPEG